MMLSCYSLTEARYVMMSSWPESSYENIIDTVFLALPNLLLIYTVSGAGDPLEDMPGCPAVPNPSTPLCEVTGAWSIECILTFLFFCSMRSKKYMGFKVIPGQTYR